MKPIKTRTKRTRTTAYQSAKAANTNALKAKIHIAKNELGLDEATYRDMLMRITGKDSCGLMTNSELILVCNELKRLGFSPKQAKPKGAKPTTTADRVALLSKVEAILADMGLPWSYANATAKQMFGVDMVHWLDAKRLYKVVQALAVYQKRHKDNKKDK